MKIKHILAKSTDHPKNPRHEETLVGHTETVLNAAHTIIKILKQVDLPEYLSDNWERFEKIVLVSAGAGNITERKHRDGEVL